MGEVHKTTVREKQLFAVIAIMFVLCIGAIFITGYQRGLVNRYGNLCTTKECVTTASTVIKQMNTSVDPCEDFFEYACGKWMSENPIPSHMSTYSVSTLLDKIINRNLRSMLEEKISDGDKDQDKKAKLYYKSCMDTDKINALGKEPALKLVEKVGGWPILDDNFKASGVRVEEIVSKANSLDVSVLWYFGIGADDKSSKTTIIQLAQPRLMFPRNYYLKKKYSVLLDAFRNLAKELAIVLGAGTDVEKQANDIVSFEIELAKISKSSNEMEDAEARYNKMNITELMSYVDNDINFLEYLKLNFAEVDFKITGDTNIVVYGKDYFKKLNELIKKTDKKTLANYVTWMVIRHSIRYLSEPIFGPMQAAFHKVTRGTTSKGSRWDTCVSTTTRAFKMGIGRLFISKYFGTDAKETVVDMIARLKAAFSKMIMHTDWMDDKTKILAVHKVKKMKEKIGYPSFLLNDTYMKLEYSGMNPKEDAYLLNTVEKWQFAYKAELETIKKPVNKLQWYMGPAEVNAYYSPNNNVVAFPAGILQPPFYDKTWPKSLNYGGIGGVVGHEITHGFDDSGRRYDADGNMKQWWPESVIQSFEKKTKCVVDKFDKYVVKSVGLHVNGKKTLGENIADIGGLKESYNAYRQWVSERGSEEDILPGLGVTHNQLFFIGYAQTWCGSRTKQSMIHKINSNEHSPYRFRVLGPVSDLKIFADAFHCKKGAKLNPEKRCNVW